MALFAKRMDPLTARERALKDDLKALENELHKLATEAPKAIRRASVPNPAPPVAPSFSPPISPASAPVSPVPTGHFNARGIRKFDLLAWGQNIKNHLSGPGGNNPAMVKMLAAGSIHGLRPLRRERRVARNRFIFLFLALLAILWGLAYSDLLQR